MLGIIATLAIGISSFSFLFWILCRPPLLLGEDRLVLPGHETTLRVRALWNFPWYPFGTREGIEVKFHERDTLLGSACTHSDGIAEIALTGSTATGLRRIRVCDPTEKSTAWITVAVWPEDTEIVVTDIDRTLTGVSDFAVLVRSNPRIPAFDGAAQTLIEISRQRQILYLTARNRRLSEKTNQWLNLQGFPPGPIVFRPRIFLFLSSGEYKFAELHQICLIWKRVTLGIGDRPGDAHAYASNGIRPILIGPRAYPNLPIATLQVRSWEEIRSLLKRGTY